MSIELLSHYSSINKLALILKSKKIRFTRLDLVNDPDEGISKDFGKMAFFKFVSCWTGNMEENFALWNMYTDRMRGIRLDLPTPVFNSYEFDGIYDFMVPEEKFMDYQNGILIYSAQNKPVKIKYTDDEKELFPNIRDAKGLKASDLGIRKRTIWEFENEVRYVLDIVPFDTSLYERTQNIFYAYKRYIDQKIPPKIEYYDIDINIESFENMKIILGPRCIPGDREIVESLIERYNPKAQIKNSNLTERIK
jgi:hypothetical protein